MGRVRATLVVVGGIALCASAHTHAQEPNVNGYVTLGSGYWKHGVAQSDGPSLQLGIDYQHHTGFFAYARAQNVDYPENYPGETRDVEASAYVGYHDRNESWSWTASYGRYVYPGAARYNYDEVSATFGLRDRVFYTASYNDEYYVRSSSALNQELSVVFPLRGDVEVGGAIGLFDVAAGPRITHWNVGASKLIGALALDLRYYNGNYEWRNYLGDPYADRYVLSVSYALRGKRRRF